MRFISVALTVVGIAAAGCSGGTSQPAAPSGGTGATTVEVGINGDAYQPGGSAVFAPDTVTVDRGTTVTWKNNDQTVHTTTASGGSWNAPVGAGGSFSRQFTASGTYEYRCTIHANMNGTVVVR